MPKVLPLLLLLNLSAFTQTTWRGLRFGMSEAEARQAYDGTFRDHEPADGAFILIDDNQKLERMPAKAMLHFDKTKMLSQINLVVENPFADQTGTEATGASLAKINMLNRLNSDLAEKYGKPVTEEGECNLRAEMIVYNPRRPFSCKKMWKSEGQTIKMDWYLLNGRLTAVFLCYASPPKDI